MATSEPGTPQAAAVAWVEAVLDRGDLLAAWPHTDAVLRLVLAQDWVWTNRHDPYIGDDIGDEIGDHEGWDDIAQGLASVPPQSRHWGRFAAELVKTWQRAWKGFEPRRWYVASAP